MSKYIILKAKTNKDFLELADYLMNIPPDINVEFSGGCSTCKHDCKNIIDGVFCEDWENHIKTFKDPDTPTVRYMEEKPAQEIEVNFVIGEITK